MSRFLYTAATAAILVLLMPSSASAGRVTAGRAVGIAAGFTEGGNAANSRRPRRAHGGMRPHRAPTGRTRTYSENGDEIFHLVELDGGGYVAVAAEEAAGGVMGFSEDDALPSSIDGPLAVLLAADAAARRKTKSAAKSSAAVLSAASVGSESALDDLRVAPLVKSKWNQTTVAGKKVYNYYTPYGYCCGCVATAMAQLMRFHEYPSASVSPATFTCYAGSEQTETNLTLVAGLYDWSAMPLVPATETLDDTMREAIGRICFDAGVSMRMRYGFDGNSSGTYGGFELEPLKSVFGYASAESYLVGDTETIGDDIVKAAILANLDAGCPVLLGIDRVRNGTSDNGHAIVADGYGYVGDTLYCHLNMGWSGANDYWYALPDIGTSYGFNAVNSVVYNIFPDKTGSLVTGRVTDPAGNPLAGATVEAVAVYTSRSSSGKPGSSRTTYVTNILECTTSEHGVYAVLAPADKSCTVYVTAVYGGWASLKASTSTSASSSPDIDWENENYSYQSALSCGNSWGNDVVVGSYSGGDAAVESFDGTGAASNWSLSFTGTPGAWYAVEQSQTLSDPSWTVVTNTVLPASGAIEVDLPAETDEPSMFYRAVPL